MEGQNQTNAPEPSERPAQTPPVLRYITKFSYKQCNYYNTSYVFLIPSHRGLGRFYRITFQIDAGGNLGSYRGIQTLSQPIGTCKCNLALLLDIERDPILSKRIPVSSSTSMRSRWMIGDMNHGNTYHLRDNKVKPRMWTHFPLMCSFKGKPPF